jgi:formylglycine-generating enzyme required for sulfatase activity/energy-coupling factor transporter ATP-binding protein EcfA2
MTRRWLLPILVALVAVGLAYYSRFWLSPLLDLVTSEPETVQALEALINLLILPGAAVLFVIRTLRESRRGELEVAVAARAPRSESETAAPSSAPLILATPLSADRMAALRAEYLGILLSAAGRVELAAIDPALVESEGRSAPRLESIYTSLRVRNRTDTPRDREAVEERKLPSALSVVDREPRLVLLGEPGSGKSTFLRFLAVCLAGELQGHERANLEALRQPLPEDDAKEQKGLQDWSTPTLLPVLVTLRDFAATGLPPVGVQPTAEHLWAFLEPTVPRGFLPGLREELSRTGGFLLFDGLDEVPQANDRRGQLLLALEAFVAALPRSRVVVTCRSYAYQDPTWRLPGFAVAELAPFDDGQIRHFVRLWYEDASHRGTGIKPELAPARAAALIGAIERNGHIRELAERPLLLTLMASLHAFGGRELPERREKLYAETVELLLYRWEKQRRVTSKAGEVWQPSLSEWLETSRSAIRRTLERLAFEAHQRQPELVGTADVPEGDLVCRLLELRTRQQDNPAELLDYLRDRAGLLLPRGIGVFTFPHRSFQEYLAACHLAASEDYPDSLAKLTLKEPERWREVTLLAAATAAEKSPGPLWDLIEALCPTGPGSNATAASAWGAHIASQALAERGLPPSLPDRHQVKVERLQSWLLALVEGSHLAAFERALAGRSLATLGDPRRNVTTLDGMEFCWVPPGPFLMGSAEDDPEGLDRERPQHELDIPYGYWMARFPVTGAQWREYVEASGAKIADERSLTLAANEPAVLVTWHEALACCRWLGSKWQEKGLLPADWQVRLPSEVEWEKAARGGIEIPVEPQPVGLTSLGASESDRDKQLNPEQSRAYPWGASADPERANYDKTGIGRPSAVGAFPRGKSPCGCEELSGNVHEWTRSLWGKDWQEPDYGYPYLVTDGRENLQADDKTLRVLRGGSYFLNARYVRCSSRLRGDPSGRGGYVGFRVLLSPFFSDP